MDRGGQSQLLAERRCWQPSQKQMREMSFCLTLDL
jgi:hypothetical protein